MAEPLGSHLQNAAKMVAGCPLILAFAASVEEASRSTNQHQLQGADQNVACSAGQLMQGQGRMHSSFGPLSREMLQVEYSKMPRPGARKDSEDAEYVEQGAFVNVDPA